MTNGYAGKILRLNLTTKSVSTIDTEQYEEYGGGHGINSAIFWDLAEDKTLTDGFDPRNIVMVMGSPLSGTLTPAASGRCEVQGVGVQQYPINWYTRSNFGGRFPGMLKYAGWDGIVIEGKADSPVWINIVDDQVTFEDASDLWGLTTFAAQEEIWSRVTGASHRFDEWLAIGNTYTTQRPAVLCIGQAGENLSRIGCLIHDAHNGAGEGGFGGVWGSKNLKAISVLGTGDFEIADPQALIDARLWFDDNFAYNPDDPGFAGDPLRDNALNPERLVRRPGDGASRLLAPCRPLSCMACPRACRRKFDSGTGNEAQCVESGWYGTANVRDTQRAVDLSGQYGLDAWQIRLHGYLRELYKMGVLGPGKAIECDLPFDKYNTLEFAQLMMKEIAYREGIGDDLAEGWARAALRWGRYKEDTDSGLLALPNWGHSQHYEPRVEVDWSYGSILGDRDINEHDYNDFIHWYPQTVMRAGLEPVIPAEELVNIMASKVLPYEGDPFMFDYGEGPTGIYSDHRVKTIAWHRHYTRFWKQSILYCDWLVFANFFTGNTAELLGATPDAEPKFFNAVTGKNLSFVDGMEIGRKIWNMDRAVMVLQGRHRDMEVHTGYVYNVPTPTENWEPVYEDGEWSFGGKSQGKGRTVNKTKFEAWKTKFYEFEGWDPSSGWPKRSTLEELDLGFVADELESAGKLGA